MAQPQRATLTFGSLKFPTPNTYGGKHDEWEDWAYKFKSYMQISNFEFGQLLNAAETSTEEVTDAKLTYEAEGTGIDTHRVEMSRLLHYALVQFTTSSASTMVRQVVSQNGFETWRLLHARFALPSETKSMGLLTRIMKPTFSEKDFEVQFAQREATLRG